MHVKLYAIRVRNEVIIIAFSLCPNKVNDIDNGQYISVYPIQYFKQHWNHVTKCLISVEYLICELFNASHLGLPTAINHTVVHVVVFALTRGEARERDRQTDRQTDTDRQTET